MNAAAELATLFGLLPPAVSDYAQRVDQLFLALLALSALLVLVLVGWVTYSMIRFRAGGTRRARRPAALLASGSKLEVGFALGLLVCFLGFFTWGGVLYLSAYSDQRQMLTINVIAKQWMWKLQHPSGAREINTLHVPVNQPIRLQLSSQDVIHSFSVPALRIKRDALPERYTQVSFTATKPGVYPLFCTEYCGTDHAGMRGKVVVLSAADYQHWLRKNAQPRSVASTGAALFEAYQCDACHQGDAAGGPSLVGLAGSQVHLQDGRQVAADDSYLRRAILQPQAELVAGAPPSMPSYQGQIDETELLALLAYIKRLTPKEDG